MRERMDDASASRSTSSADARGAGAAVAAAAAGGGNAIHHGLGPVIATRRARVSPRRRGPVAAQSAATRRPPASFATRRAAVSCDCTLRARAAQARRAATARSSACTSTRPPSRLPRRPARPGRGALRQGLRQAQLPEPQIRRWPGAGGANVREGRLELRVDDDGARLAAARHAARGARTGNGVALDERCASAWLRSKARGATSAACGCA